MQNVQKADSMLSSDRIDSQTTPIPESAYLHSRPYIPGAILVRDTPTTAMQPRIDFSGLVKQLNWLATNHSDQAIAMHQVSRLVGETFQADGCLVLFTTASGVMAQTASWVAGSGQAAISPPFTLSCQQAERLDDRLTTIISDVHSVTETLEVKQWVNSLSDLCVTDSRTCGSFPVSSLLEVSAQLSESLRVRVSLLRSHPFSWPASQVEQLEMAAQQVAALLSQINLRQKLNQQAGHQRVAKQIAMAVHNSSNLNELFQLAAHSVATSLEVKRAMLLRLKYWDPLFRNRTEEQIPKAQVTLTCEWDKELQESNPISSPDLPPAPPNPSFWMSECSLCQQAFLHSPQAIVIDSSQSLVDKGYLSTSAFSLGEMSTFLIAPVESQGTVLGFLVLQDQQPRCWQPEEIELVELVSAQISTAIIQAETLKQVQSLVDKRTAELKQSLTVQAKLYERTRIQLEQLRHLNQLKDEFLDTVSHELRTPLTSMALAIRMLRQTGLEGDRGARYLDILEQQCAQETNLINDLLALQELDSKQTTLQLEEFDLVELIQTVIPSFQSRWAAKGLTLELDLPDLPLSLLSDRESLTRILVELFTNATRYSEPQTSLHLAVSSQQADRAEQIVITVSNQGTAIPPDELPYIFDRFRRCHSAVQNAVPGTGLGLALVKSLAQHLNGTISASSVPTECAQSWETCFTLTLPRVPDNSI